MCACPWWKPKSKFWQTDKKITITSECVCGLPFYAMYFLCPGRGCLGVPCNLTRISHLSAWLRFRFPRVTALGFSHSSVGKESTCSEADRGSIPGLGRSPGEGNGNPLQYSCLENPMDWGAWRATVQGVARVGHDLVTKTTTIKPAYSPARQVMTHHHCSLLLDRLAPVRALWLVFQSLKNTWSHQRITFSNCFPLSASSKVRL